MIKLLIAVCDPDSVLPDVLAIHTIEMIPKSMILKFSQTFFSQTKAFKIITHFF